MVEINDRRVSYLYEAVCAGSIRNAADRLNLAPSAISRQITQLEQEMGVAVIERGRHGVRVTEAGEVLIRYYRELKGLQDTYLSEINQLRGLSKGMLKLAVGEGFVPDLMSQPLATFNHTYPGISLDITTTGTNDVIRMVEMNEVHIGLVYHPAKRPEIRSHIINAQPIQAITSTNHPLAKTGQPVTLESLLDYPIALLGKAFGVRQMFMLAEFQERLHFEPAMVTNSFVAVKHFAISDMGITVLPPFVVTKEVEEGTLKRIPILNDILQSGESHVITRVGRTLPGGAHELLKVLNRWLQRE